MVQTKQFTLILLYEKVASSLSVAQALREKDIDVHVVQNAAELIQSIATKKIDMVGLSVNHASTSSLIQVLKDKTRIQILVFGEDKLPATLKKVDNLDVSLKISGIANGYNIFMKIGNLVKLKEKDSEESRGFLLTGGGEKQTIKKKKGAAFIVKGKSKIKNEKEEQDNVVERKSTKRPRKDNEEAWDQEIESEFAQEEIQGEEDSQESAEGQESQIKNKKSGHAPFSDHSEEKNPSTSFQKEKKKPSSPLLFKKNDQGKDNRKEKKSPSPVVKVEKQKQKPHPLGVGGTIVFSDEAAATKKPHKGSSKEEAGSVSAPEKSSEKKSTNNIINFEAHRGKNSKRRREKWEGDKGPKKAIGSVKKMDQEVAKPVTPMAKLKHKKQFKEAVLKAGENAFTKTDESQDFGLVNKVCIVPVMNSKEQGFLIFCVNDNQFLTEEGLSQFKDKLNEEMKASAGEDFELGDTFNIETFDVDIQEWAGRSCSFSFSFNEANDGKQIFVGFMKHENLYPDFKLMEEPNGTLRMHIHTMPPLTPVGFDVFLYFIKNKRLIPYVRKGGSFTLKQIQRLYKKGFKFLYVSQEDKNEVLSFYISLSINQELAAALRKLA